jgi:hypothetical protein
MCATCAASVAHFPPTDFSNPATGQCRDTNGLGQMYMFGADGGYTYAGFLRLQNGQCRTEVSAYQQGQARRHAALRCFVEGFRALAPMLRSPVGREAGLTISQT